MAEPVRSPMADPAPGRPRRPRERAPRSSRFSRAGLMLALVLVAAAIALLVMDRDAAPRMDMALPRGLEGEPDVFMEGAQVAQFRNDGSLQYRLAADEIRHFDAGALTRLNQPRLTLHDPENPPWQVSARRGAITRPSGAEELVTLDEDVVLQQTRPDGATLRLETPVLRLYPERQYAETDQDVMIDAHVGRTTARGLKGDLQVGILEFFSLGDDPVHTVLVPAQFK